VFRAYEPDIDRLVAVKRFDLNVPPDQVHRFSAELDFLVQADLSHPAIAAPIATGITGVAAYLAQDFVSADALDRVTGERRHMAPSEAVRIVRQLAAAFDFAAAVGVYHGAFHARDVLVSPDEVRLTGLGIAQSLERIGVTPPIRRPFTAPEQLAGQTWNYRADLFALAALAHELLWGKRVTATGDAAAIDLADLPGGDSDLLRGAFARGLAEDPGERFENASAFAEELAVAFSESVTEDDELRLATDDRVELDVGYLPLDDGHSPEPELRDLAPAEPVASQSPTPDELKAFAAEQHLEAGRATGPTSLGSADWEVSETAEPYTAPPSDDSDAVASGPRTEIEPFRAAVFISPEEAQSALWPVVLAAIIFAAMGFAAGNAVATLGGLALFGGASPGGLVQESVAPNDAAPPAPAQGTELVEPRPVNDAPVVLPSQVSAPQIEPEPVAPAAAPTSAPPAVPEARPSAPEPGPLSLTVESRPAGAAVFVDSRRIGNTPLVTTAITIGEHAIRLELGGYQDWATSVVIAVGPNRIAASMQP